MSATQNSRRRATPRAIEAVTFDVTHTLIHTPRLAQIYRDVLARHGLETTERQLANEIPGVWQEFTCRSDPWTDRFTSHPKGARGWWHEFLERLCRRLGLGEPSRFASSELFDRFLRPGAWEVYPDVRSTLETLSRAGVRLGVVSNWDERLPRLLDALDLGHFFDAVTFSSAVGIEKPNPRIFLHCLRALGVAPANALHVGDGAVDDVEGAMAAGMQALRVDRRETGLRLDALIAPLLQASSSMEGIASRRNRGRHVRH